MALCITLERAPENLKSAQPSGSFRSFRMQARRRSTLKQKIDDLSWRSVVILNRLEVSSLDEGIMDLERFASLGCPKLYLTMSPRDLRLPFNHLISGALVYWARFLLNSNQMHIWSWGAAVSFGGLLRRRLGLVTLPLPLMSSCLLSTFYAIHALSICQLILSHNPTR